MGSVCTPEERVFRKIEEYIHPDNVYISFKRADGNHSRFGNIQKIRTRKNDIFKLIMATNDAKMQTVSIQCRIMQSTAEFELYDGTKFELLDKMISPLIDMFNPSENQIYHPIKTLNKHSLTMKSYPFTSFSDNMLKKAIYEIWVYNELRSMSPLVDYFIMSRGKVSTIVMIFKNFETSLLEIARYRQLADYHWNEAELVTLWKILINNYKNLKNMSICHRDIRLGKIFYSSENKNQPFQLANLETARKVTKTQASDLLTVVGVSLFAEYPMNEKIQKQQQLALYDPLSYDTNCLIRVLLSLLNLDPLESHSLQCKNQKLAPIISKLKRETPNFDEIERHLETILRSFSYEKNQLFKEDKIISDHLSKSELRRKNREKIDEAYFNALLQLHKKEIFNRLLIEKMEQNDNSNRKFQNIAILHKVGNYYASIGLEKNQYYEQQFRLLLDLAKQCRQEQFYSDHEQYLNQLGELQQIISKDNHDLSIKYYNELIYKFINQGKLDAANQYLSNLLEQSYKYNDIHINIQIDILFTKLKLEIVNSKLETAENTIQKISFIVTSNNFDSQYDAKKYQAESQYLKAYLEIQVMSKLREEIKKKRIAAAETSISTALGIFTNLPESNQNTIKIINTYLLKSDLANLKEDYIESKKSLDSADILVNQLEKHGSVSDALKVKVLQRLKVVYEKSNKANESSYKATLSRLGKINQRFEESNASRHQRTKELKSRQRMRTKQERIVTNQEAIQQLNEEDES